MRLQTLTRFASSLRLLPVPWTDFQYPSCGSAACSSVRRKIIALYYCHLIRDKCSFLLSGAVSYQEFTSPVPATWEPWLGEAWAKAGTLRIQRMPLWADWPFNLQGKFLVGQCPGGCWKPGAGRAKPQSLSYHSSRRYGGWRPGERMLNTVQHSDVTSTLEVMS